MKKFDYVLVLLALLGLCVIVFALVYEIYETHNIFVSLLDVAHVLET